MTLRASEHPPPVYLLWRSHSWAPCCWTISARCWTGIKHSKHSAHNPSLQCVRIMRSLHVWILVSATVLASAALAADPDHGKRLAQARCAGCHPIEPHHARQVADAPPFELIARKFDASAEMLAFALLGPHPRMNVVLTRREARDIAAFISTLAK